MKLHLPLLLTVWAQVVCTDYKPLDAESLDPGWFDVPEAYERKEADPYKAMLGPS